MAVYTDVSDEELRTFLTAYDAGHLRACKGIAEGVENSNFMLRTEAGSFLLTLYEKRVNPEDLPFFLGLMQHLAGKGLSCPVPIRRRDGALYGTLAGKPAALVSFLEGVSVHRPHPSHCAELGAGLARLHLAGCDFPLHRANALDPAGWRRLFGDCAPRADTVQPGLQDFIHTELETLSRHWPRNLPSGIIHADLFPDNVFFIEGCLSGMIDFYFACNEAFAYDLAICLNAWCFENKGEFNITKARALLHAYQRIRPLTPEEQDALPWLARGSALRFLLTRLYDWLHHAPGALVKPKDPLAYRKRLRFHQRVGNISDYGLDFQEPA